MLPRCIHKRLVDGYDLCSPCATGCLPCSNIGCKRRALPENDGRCDDCMRRRLVRSSAGSTLASDTQCSQHVHGCKNLAALRDAAGLPVCRRCFTLGIPCSNASIGCCHRVALKSVGSALICRMCLRYGLPCRGPDGNGCLHPRRQKGQSFPRRQKESNNSMCAACAPKICRTTGCSARVHENFWSAGLCYRHGIVSTPDKHAPTNRTDAHRFAWKALRRSTPLMESKCYVRWCTNLASHIVTPSSGSKCVCSAHRIWFVAPNGNGRRGVRRKSLFDLILLLCLAAEPLFSEVLAG